MAWQEPGLSAPFPLTPREGMPCPRGMTTAAGRHLARSPWKRLNDDSMQAVLAMLHPRDAAVLAQTCKQWWVVVEERAHHSLSLAYAWPLGDGWSSATVAAYTRRLCAAAAAGHPTALAARALQSLHTAQRRVWPLIPGAAGRTPGSCGLWITEIAAGVCMAGQAVGGGGVPVEPHNSHSAPSPHAYALEHSDAIMHAFGQALCALADCARGNVFGCDEWHSRGGDACATAMAWLTQWAQTYRDMEAAALASTGVAPPTWRDESDEVAAVLTAARHTAVEDAAAVIMAGADAAAWMQSLNTYAAGGHPATMSRGDGAMQGSRHHPPVIPGLSHVGAALDQLIGGLSYEMEHCAHVHKARVSVAHTMAAAAHDRRERGKWLRCDTGAGQAADIALDRLAPVHRFVVGTAVHRSGSVAKDASELKRDGKPAFTRLARRYPAGDAWPTTPAPHQPLPSTHALGTHDREAETRASDAISVPDTVCTTAATSRRWRVTMVAGPASPATPPCARGGVDMSPAPTAAAGINLAPPFSLTAERAIKMPPLALRSLGQAPPPSITSTTVDSAGPAVDGRSTRSDWSDASRALSIVTDMPLPDGATRSPSAAGRGPWTASAGGRGSDSGIAASARTAPGGAASEDGYGARLTRLSWLGRGGAHAPPTTLDAAPSPAAPLSLTDALDSGRVWADAGARWSPPPTLQIGVPPCTTRPTVATPSTCRRLFIQSVDDFSPLMLPRPEAEEPARITFCNVVGDVVLAQNQGGVLVAFPAVSPGTTTWRPHTPTPHMPCTRPAPGAPSPPTTSPSWVTSRMHRALGSRAASLPSPPPPPSLTALTIPPPPPSPAAATARTMDGGSTSSPATPPWHVVSRVATTSPLDTAHAATPAAMSVTPLAAAAGRQCWASCPPAPTWHHTTGMQPLEWCPMSYSDVVSTSGSGVVVSNTGSGGGASPSTEVCPLPHVFLNPSAQHQVHCTYVVRDAPEPTVVFCCSNGRAALECYALPIAAIREGHSAVHHARRRIFTTDVFTNPSFIEFNSINNLALTKGYDMVHRRRVVKVWDLVTFTPLVAIPTDDVIDCKLTAGFLVLAAKHATAIACAAHTGTVHVPLPPSTNPPATPQERVAHATSTALMSLRRALLANDVAGVDAGKASLEAYGGNLLAVRCFPLRRGGLGNATCLVTPVIPDHDIQLLEVFDRRLMIQQVHSHTRIIGLAWGDQSTLPRQRCPTPLAQVFMYAARQSLSVLPNRIVLRDGEGHVVHEWEDPAASAVHFAMQRCTQTGSHVQPLPDEAAVIMLGLLPHTSAWTPRVTTEVDGPAAVVVGGAGNAGVGPPPPLPATSTTQARQSAPGCLIKYCLRTQRPLGMLRGDNESLPPHVQAALRGATSFQYNPASGMLATGNAVGEVYVWEEAAL